MNFAELILMWFWGIAQATCLALIVWAVATLAGRLPPAARAAALLTTLGLMGLLPWSSLFIPRHHSPIGLAWLFPTPTTVSESGSVDEPSAAPRPTAPPTDSNPELLEGSQSKYDLSELSATATRWLDAFVQPPVSPTSRVADWSIRRWLPSLVASACGLFVLWGLMRWLLGTWQVARLARHSQLCHDDRLWDIAEPLAAELNINTPVEYRCSDLLTTPAVLGWRRPTVVLPADWTEWSPQLLRSALAHELAHVRRRDPLTTAVAQLVLALNYFHPLAHVLARQLRLDQELAADSIAAPLAGGRQAYLESLAGLALRRSPSPIAGPALAFLPSRHTFVRRLEMLRTLPLTSHRYARLLAQTAPLAVLLIGLVIATVRPALAQVATTGQAPATGQSTGAAPPAGAQTTGAQATNDVPELIRYVPDGAAGLVIEIDVVSLVANPAFAPIVNAIPADQRVLNMQRLKLPLDRVERVVIVGGKQLHETPPLALIRLTQPTRLEDLVDSNANAYGDEVASQLDSRTIAVGKVEPNLLRLAAAVGQPGTLAQRLTRHANSPVRLAWQGETLLRAMRLPDPAVASTVAPLLRDVETGSAGLTLTDKIAVQVLLDTQHAQDVADTLTALRTLAKNALRNLPSAATEGIGGEQDVILGMAQSLALPMLDSATVEQRPDQVELKLEMDKAVPVTVGLLVPAVQAAREAARRAQASNNLKQIVLALHNHESSYRRFPPAIITENGVQRSWRVEILPFIGRDDLYRAYRKDQPWDSEANLQVMKQMPQVFATAGAQPGSEFKTGIRGIGGPKGVFGGPNKDGTQLSDIVDGTSNTMAVVEVDALVEWTRPDDFAPTPADLIKHGRHAGGFLAAFADGSVHLIADSIDPTVVQGLLTINGGEVVDLWQARP